MQGKLREIDIHSILQLVALGQKTGELFVEADLPARKYGLERRGSDDLAATQPAGRSWFVFFSNGRIVYATDAPNNHSRLKDYSRRYQGEATLARLMASPSAALNVSEYEYLWLLLENHLLTPAQSRSIIHGMVHETLFDLLSLHQGSFSFATGPALSPQLTALDISAQLTRMMKQVQQWKQLYPYIQSPEQCLAIADIARLQGLLSNRTFSKLSRFADGKTSIRQIARYLNRDMLTVARAIYPYIQQGAIRLSQPGFQEPGVGMDSKVFLSSCYPAPNTHPPTIVCVDDEVSVRETVQTTLKSHGYAVTTIADPVDALNLIMRLQPNLILCDSVIPTLDGYEMCSMLRQSKACRYTPIVLLAGKDGLTEQVRARLVGATDYLTKPFKESELLMLVEKYAGLGYAKPSQLVTLLADPSDDRLQIDRTDASPASTTPLN
ncbi:response regulator [Leptodesmis sp.]|uniref:response regulator n=1 Tax=Leptodesmis sp. TaxID=3100501 RepID=UPI004053520A